MYVLYDNVLNFINTFNGRDKYYYTNGGCYGFFKKLKKEFPEAEGYYDSKHVITKIEDKFFDVTGEIEKSLKHISIEKYYGYDHMEKSFKNR